MVFREDTGKNIEKLFILHIVVAFMPLEIAKQLLSNL